MTKSMKDTIYGALYGTAFGDSWGNVTEFMKHKKILQWKPTLPQLALITDDTQMSLYNIAALKTITSSMDVEQLTTDSTMRDAARIIFANEHVNFYFDDDNDRAPGMTCMTSLANYVNVAWNASSGREGALDNDSKGCGANMRAMWLGLLPYSDAAIATLAIIQAETTHNNKTAGVTAAATALLTKRIVQGHELNGDGSFMKLTVDILEGLQDGSLGWNSWSRRLNTGLTEAIEFFMDKFLLYSDFAYSSHETDVNRFMGEGWVADEALANAAAVADLYGQTPHHGIERLVYTNGDSDSIAAIGGAYFGAYNGSEWLEGFEQRLEARYQVELADAASWIESQWV